MKNHYMRTALTLILAASLAVQASAAVYTGIGEAEFSRDSIAVGLEYAESKSTDSNGKNQRAYIFEYTPGSQLLPSVSWGSTVWGKDRLGSMVTEAKNDGAGVIAAINGDFYSMQTGVPLGTLISDGKLISGSGDAEAPRYAIGFMPDGKAIIGKPEIKISLTDVNNGNKVSVDCYNKYPTIWGAYLVDADFASTSMSSVESLEIVIELGAPLTAKGGSYCKVRDVITGDYNNSIPDGCAILTIADECARQPLFEGIKPGDTLYLETECAPGWENVITAIGGDDLLLENGKMPDGIIDEAHEKTSNPRTAVGIKADGTVVFFAVDGRVGASRGLTETELSAVMAELGCVSALNLDGGGSTSVMVKRSGEADCAYVNLPADGSYRSISTGILFKTESSDKIPANLTASGKTPTVLVGSSVEIKPIVADRAYVPINDATYTDLTLGFAGQYANNIGSVSGSVFTAGNVPGEYRLSLAAKCGETPIYGRSYVRVTDKLDRLEVGDEYIRLMPGEIAKLDLKAYFGGDEVIASPASFVYTLNGDSIVPNQADYPGALYLCDLGYIDSNGNFISFGGADYEGEVVIGITHGSISKNVRVVIGTKPDLLADFEEASELGRFTLTSSEPVSSLRLGASSDGFKSSSSLELGYSFECGSIAKLFDLEPTEKVTIASGASSIKVRLSGDISGSMSAIVRDSSGRSHTLEYKVTKDYSKQLGWREFTALIPESLTGMLELESLLTVSDLGSGERVLRIDSAEVSYGKEAPALMGLEEHWGASALLDLYDRTVITDEDCEARDGKLYYDPEKPLTRGEFAKLIVRWLGLDITPYMTGYSVEEGTSEVLMPYIRTAIAHGLMKGYGTDENGVLIFKASTEITREQVCTVMGLLLDIGIDSELPFTDADKVSSWALDGVKKCVAAGLMKGYADDTLRPGNTIKRAEIASVLTRM